MKTAIMGYGTVGSGVAEVLSKNAGSISRRLNGETLELKRILDLRDFPGDENESKLTKDFNDILNDSEIKIVCEAMGGCNPAYDFTKKLLAAGKHVVTSNKELVASYGAELLKIAEENNVNYLFEASVGGGVPIIRPLSTCLAANNIKRIYGILNGTTNFILTKMYNDDMPFDEALALAQKLGYAEKDPTADICGHDVCRKICILASLCFGKHIYPEQVETSGIEKLSIRDVAYAKAHKCEIKLLGYAEDVGDGKVDAVVSPFMVSNDSQISHVYDVFNGIIVHGDMVGEVFFYGRGAGKLPTASACAADMIDCALNNDKRKIFGWENSSENIVADHKQQTGAYYVRGTGDINEIKKVFGGVEFISLQGAPGNEIAFITQQDTESVLDEKIESVKDFSVKAKIRVLV